MAFSSETDRARYSQELAEYTLRQFTEAKMSPDGTAKLPVSQTIKLSRLLGVLYPRLPPVAFGIDS
jgi:hypothetical protein